MRPIKFREPIVNRKGVFVDWHYWGVFDGCFIAPILYKNPHFQFTGFCDKEGQQIWEGDIMEYFTTYDKRITVVVEYEAGFMLPHGHIAPPTLKVIGNVYENPELLEDGKIK